MKTTKNLSNLFFKEYSYQAKMFYCETFVLDKSSLLLINTGMGYPRMRQKNTLVPYSIVKLKYCLRIGCSICYQTDNIKISRGIFSSS